MIKNRNWQEATSYYKRGRGFELGTTENKSSKWPVRGSNPIRDTRLRVRRSDQSATLSPEVKVIHTALTRSAVVYHIFKQ